MMPHLNAIRHLRGTLFGSAGAALGLILATTAQAQSSATGTGTRSLANQQAVSGSTTLADASNAAIGGTAGGAVDSATLAVSDNATVATARANQVDQSIAADLLGADDHGPTTLTVDASGATADAGAAIANRQARSSAFTAADIFGSAPTVDAGRVASSNVGLSRNSENTLAIGSDATAAIDLNGLATGSGAGIANQQVADRASDVASRTSAGTAVSAAGVSDSRIDSSDNLDRALAYGNAADNKVTASIGTVIAPGNSEAPPAMLLAPVSSAAPVTALFAILSDQTNGGVVKARAGDVDTYAPAFTSRLAGDVGGSSLASDRNAQVAASYANSATNAVALDSGSISVPASGDGSAGAVAAVTSIQRAGGSAVKAFTVGGNETQVAGGVSGSTISASDGTVRTVATGNLASGNMLTVSADAVDAPAVALSGTPGATALVQGSGNVTSAASFAVQNVQDAGTGTVAAWQTDNAVRLSAGGVVGSSAITGDRNSVSSAATGNAAIDSAAIETTRLRGSAAVNSLQTGDGAVTSTLGTADNPSGVRIAVGGALHDGALSVAGNTANGSTIGSSASNSLMVSGTDVASGNPPVTAAAGAIGNDYGAAADLALASNQKLGDPAQGGILAPTITSTAFGDYRVQVTGGVEGGTLTADDNAQQTQAIGNTAANRLGISTNGLGSSAALSSSQYGQATVAAVSDARFGVDASLAGASASLSGNSDSALGIMNDADNALAIDTTRISGTGSGAELTTDQLGPPRATGDHVLANQQFATGSVSGTATTSLAATGTGTGLNGASVTIADNQIQAETDANRAINSASLSATSGAADTGLVNTQTSIAATTASAQTTLGYSVTTPATFAVANAPIVLNGNGTTALARGNAADNAVSLSLGAATGAIPATVAADRFDASANADAGLVSSQTNYGPVLASAVATTGVPLNAGSVRSSSIGITGSDVAATGYGNSATNNVTVSGLGALPSAGIANLQTNYGAVTAQVSASASNGSTGSFGGSTFGVTGNSLAATAVGNQANSAIRLPR